MMANTFGLIRAAAIPCASRATTKTVGSGASPQAAEAATKRASPAANVRRRPIKSPSRPAPIRKTAKVRP